MTTLPLPSTITALVVDDDDANLDAMQTVLEDAHFVVLRARDGGAAMRVFRESAVDVVVLDLMMPIMDGWTFLERVRRSPALRDLPIVVVSAHYDPLRDVGRVRFLPKPLSADALVRAVTEAVARRQRTQA